MSALHAESALASLKRPWSKWLPRRYSSLCAMYPACPAAVAMRLHMSSELDRPALMPVLATMLSHYALPDIPCATRQRRSLMTKLRQGSTEHHIRVGDEPGRAEGEAVRE